LQDSLAPGRQDAIRCGTVKAGIGGRNKGDYSC